MPIISVKKFRLFSLQQPDADVPLRRWERIARHAEWVSPGAMRQDFPDASFVGELTVVDIGGNKFRLVTYVDYEKQVVFIKNVLTHQEYDHGSWRNR